MTKLKPPKPATQSVVPATVLPPAIDDAYKSPGVVGKPVFCNDCQFRTSSAGFVADFCPEDPKLALFMDFPSSEDVLEQRPWAGRAGYAWTAEFLEPAGLERSDVLICHALRCRPKDHKYPTGTLKRSAEITCRKYDCQQWVKNGTEPGGIQKFDPNLFLITFHPGDSRRVSASLGPLIVSDIRRAADKIAKGYRPCVVMGTDAMELVAPWTAGKGGAPAWRGHFWEGEWPWKKGTDLVKPGFMWPTQRRRK